MKPLAAPVIARSVLAPQDSGPPPRRRESRATPSGGQRRRRWLPLAAPPARILLGRRPTA